MLFQMDAPPAGDDPCLLIACRGQDHTRRKGNSRGRATRIESKIFTARDFGLEKGQSFCLFWRAGL